MTGISCAGICCIYARISERAVRELRPVPRARLLFAGERLELDVLVAGVFGEAPQAGVKGFFRVHAAAWGRAGRSAAAGGGESAIDKAGRESDHGIIFTPRDDSLKR